MIPERLPLSETLAGLTPEWPHDPLPEINAALEQSGKTIVVIDDDPLGTQTVHGVSVLTDGSVEAIVEEFDRGSTAFYILANSRGMSPSNAKSVNAKIARNLADAAKRASKDFVVINRSDSTLRGHFSEEVAAIIESLGIDFDACIFAPFFLEGGRYTIDDVHYAAEGDWLVPVGETEFARDPSFPFQSSNLREWMEEKTHGRVKANDVASVSLEDLRDGGPSKVAERLGEIEGGKVCIVNAASMRDLEVLNLALLDSEARGKRFIYRTAASFIRARLGQTAKPMLAREDFASPSINGGLVIVGSYTNRTTSQLEHLLENTAFVKVEARVEELLARDRSLNEVLRVAREADDHIISGNDVAIFTSRRQAKGSDSEESISIIERVSEGLVQIVQSITSRPRFLVAKGGNTASDLATKGLKVRRCVVPGQIFPGVPVWELGEESRFPGLKYVVFPGNVAGSEALTEIAAKLARS